MKPTTDATRRLLRPIRTRGRESVHLELDKSGKFFVLSSWIGSSMQLNPPPAIRTLLSRIPERKENGARWKIAATDFTVAIIAAAWPADQLMLLDQITTATYNMLRLRLEAQGSSMLDYARYKAKGILPEHSLAMSKTNPLRAHQVCAAVNAVKLNEYAFFMKQGTGKTASAISVLDTEASRAQKYLALIVVPAAVRLNWQSEIERFASVPVNCTVLRGTQLTRMDQLIRGIDCEVGGYSAVIVSYDCMINSWESIGRVPWDCAVLDESQYIKSWKSNRAKWSRKLRDRSNKRLILTGTYMDSVMDLFSQLEFLYEGGSGFSSFAAFKRFYGQYVRNDEGEKRLVGFQNMPLMQERLTRMSFMVTKEEALPDLPPKQYDVEEVSMSGRQAEVYEELQENMIVEIDKMMTTSGLPESVVAQNVLTMLLRLAQITSGFMTYSEQLGEDGITVVRPKIIEPFTPNPKLEMLVDLLKDPQRDPLGKTIVWACWKQDLNAIFERLKAEGLEAVQYHGSISDAAKAEAVDRFNSDDRCTHMVANPQSGGTGLNLLGYPPGKPEHSKMNCDWLIYYSQNWRSIVREQSEDRPHRDGTRVPVRITDLCVPGSIDEQIRARVTDKITAAIQLSDVRSILKVVLGDKVAA